MTKLLDPGGSNCYKPERPYNDLKEMRGMALLPVLGHRTRKKGLGTHSPPADSGVEVLGQLLQHTGRWRPTITRARSVARPSSQCWPLSHLPGAGGSHARESAWGRCSGRPAPQQLWAPAPLPLTWSSGSQAWRRSRPAVWPWSHGPRSGLELDSELYPWPHRLESRDSQGRPSTAHVYRSKSHSSMHP